MANPFSLYSFYLDTIKPIEIKERNADLKDTIKMLEDQIKNLESELSL